MVEKDKGKKSSDKMTPEERLFKVIATGGRDFDRPSERPPDDSLDEDPFSRLERFFQKLKNFIRGGHFRERLRDWVEQSRARRQGRPLVPVRSAWSEALARRVELKTINQGLAAAAGLLAVYLFFDFIFGTGYKPLTAGPSASVSRTLKAAAVREPLPLDHYLKPAAARNLFLPPAPSQPQGAPPPPAEAAPPAHVKLVGISWDDQEYVAMIEYEGEKGAAFVRKGETLKNGARIEDIKEYSVALSLDEQRWELT